MGNCCSCESTNVAMVKVIQQAGRLQEFAYPVKVSQVLEKNPTSFICNMDDMDFDSFVSAIHGDEDLQPGRLYFALPMSWLKSPLRGEKMASLAVKTSLALKTSGGGRWCGCGLKSSDIDFLKHTSNSVLGSSSPEVVVSGGRGVCDGGRRSMMKQKRQGVGGRGGGGRGRFATGLNIILEEQAGD